MSLCVRSKFLRSDLKGVPRYIDKELQQCPALAMELISGRPIFNLIDQDIMFDKVTALMEMIKIVANIHAEGILHNDLKPENFMLAREGRVLPGRLWKCWFRGF